MDFGSTSDCDENKKTQNCGVMVKGEGNNGEFSCYGVILDITELCYIRGKKIAPFRCNWYDTFSEGICYKNDHYGIISVNMIWKLHKNEPLVLVSQVTQVYYIKSFQDPIQATVITTMPTN